ncbi:DUF1795 domain-containing protein [Trinickia sp. LjRoot230]|uniref:DcrB-related protein n=1 Tax=Trinickia sp. LjRoot230 TaxID=3342288 RepID=UPI003ECE1754
MQYTLQEGSFVLPDAAADRTVNMLLLNTGPGALNLVVSRDKLRDGENLDAFIERQWTTAARQVSDLKEVARRPVFVGRKELHGVQIDSTMEQEGRTFHQSQTIFQLGADGRMLVMTLTCASPLTDEQQAAVKQMLDSFVPRPPESAAASADSPVGQS